MGHIFISYSSLDQALADEVVAKLEALGRTCWISSRDVPSGARYGAELTRAVDAADAVVLLLTERAATSEHCARELELALDARIAIYPVRLTNAAIPPEMRYFLAGLQWTTTDGDAWVERLASALPGAARAAKATPSVVEAAAPQPSTVGSDVGDGVDVPGQGVWTPAMLATLHSNLRYPLVRMLLDACAVTPGAWIPKASIDARSERGPNQLRNELGAFSKLTKKLFGDVSWPMEWRRNNGAFEYRMDGVLGPIWYSLSQAESSGT